MSLGGLAKLDRYSMFSLLDLVYLEVVQIDTIILGILSLEWEVSTLILKC